MTDPAENERRRMRNERTRVSNEADPLDGRVAAETGRDEAEGDRAEAERERGRAERGRADAAGLRAKRLRAWLLAVGVFVIVVAVGGVYLINYVNKVDRLSQDNKTTAARNHRARLADQARTDAALRQLACILVSQAKPSGPQSQLINHYRAVYHCPPYSIERARNPFLPLPPVKKPAATPAPRGSRSSSRATAQPTHGPSPPARTTSATPTPSAPLSSHSTALLCKLAPVLCKLPVIGTLAP